MRRGPALRAGGVAGASGVCLAAALTPRRLPCRGACRAGVPAAPSCLQPGVPAAPRRPPHPRSCRPGYLPRPGRLPPAGGRPGCPGQWPAARHARHRRADGHAVGAAGAGLFQRRGALTQGAGVTVAVVDSGVDANPQFGDRVTVGPDLAGASPGSGRRGLRGPRHGGGQHHRGRAAGRASRSTASPRRRPSCPSRSPTRRPSPGTCRPRRSAMRSNLGASVINLSLADRRSTPGAPLGGPVRAGQQRGGRRGGRQRQRRAAAAGPFYPAGLSRGALGRRGRTRTARWPVSPTPERRSRSPRPESTWPAPTRARTRTPTTPTTTAPASRQPSSPGSPRWSARPTRT